MIHPLIKQSGDLIVKIDEKLWNAAFAQDHKLYERLDRIHWKALKRHGRRQNAFSTEQITKQ